MHTMIREEEGERKKERGCVTQCNNNTIIIWTGMTVSECSECMKRKIERKSKSKTVSFFWTRHTQSNKLFFG